MIAKVTMVVAGFFCLVLFFWPHLQHMEVPRLGVKSELQRQAYAIATEMLNLSHICDLCCSLWQCWIFNPLTKLGIKPKPTSSWIPCWVLNPLSHSGNSDHDFFFYLSNQDKEEKKHGELPMGTFHGLDLEWAAITSIYNLLTRSRSHGCS